MWRSACRAAVLWSSWSRSLTWTRLAPPQPSPQRPQTPWLQLQSKMCICIFPLPYRREPTLCQILCLYCLRALP